MNASLDFHEKKKEKKKKRLDHTNWTPNLES